MKKDHIEEFAKLFQEAKNTSIIIGSTFQRNTNSNSNRIEDRHAGDIQAFKAYLGKEIVLKILMQWGLMGKYQSLLIQGTEPISPLLLKKEIVEYIATSNILARYMQAKDDDTESMFKIADIGAVDIATTVGYAQHLIMQSDLCIVIGELPEPFEITKLVTYYGPNHIIILNKKDTALDRCATLKITDSSVKVLEEVGKLACDKQLFA